ncbi:hypothetical protein Drorol1_Dr00019649 [Drosera rotundifolia]
MLIDILESFQGTEFCYMEQWHRSMNSSRTVSFRKVVPRQDEKWWLPVPYIPPGGLSEHCRKHLKHQRDCANQIHKAAMANNANILNEMAITALEDDILVLMCIFFVLCTPKASY